MRHIYTPVCTLAQQHSYFQEPATASVRLAPTPDTVEKLRRAGLLLKPVGTGLTVLRELAISDAPPKPDAPVEQARPLPDFLFPLRFAVQPISPYFWNFTALPDSDPANGGRTIYYFHAGTAVPDGNLRLTVPNAQTLLLTPLALSVPAAAPVAGGPAITEEIWDLVRGKQLPAAIQQRHATGLNIDLHAWGAGRYQLQRNGQELLGCYADDQLHATQTWAVLEIERAALAAGPLNILFAFEARRTRWRYLIRYRPSPDSNSAIPEKPSIKVKVAKGEKIAKDDNATALVSFAQPAERPTTGPTADLIFESDEALALAERPGLACTLHYTLHGTPVAVALPAAQGEVLCRPAVPATTPPGPAFSEIVVLL